MRTRGPRLIGPGRGAGGGKGRKEKKGSCVCLVLVGSGVPYSSLSRGLCLSSLSTRSLHSSDSSSPAGNVTGVVSITCLFVCVLFVLSLFYLINGKGFAGTRFNPSMPPHFFGGGSPARTPCVLAIACVSHARVALSRRALCGWEEDWASVSLLALRRCM